MLRRMCNNVFYNGATAFKFPSGSEKSIDLFQTFQKNVSLAIRAMPGILNNTKQLGVW